MTQPTIGYPHAMRRRCFLVLVTLVACTKQNPRSCRDGVCNDPSLPYCDVGGELSGTPFTCIAGDCTPGDFAACRGDTAITCNTAGTSFDDVQCELGCNAASGGCRLCNPNEMACTNGTLATCDANGAVVSSEKCPLGCFEDQPRCRDIDPSNGLAEFLDQVANPPDLDLKDVFFQTDTGSVVSGTTSVDVPNFLVPASGDGGPIRVFVANTARIEHAIITVSGDPRNAPGPAFALVARGQVSIRGQNVVEPRAGAALLGCNAGAGAAFVDQDHRSVSSGGGGGGNATAGAAGGAVNGIVNPVAAAVGGSVAGNDTLTPLRGGCSGGMVLSGNGTYPSGGGAIQLTSRIGIDIDGVIDARGINQSDGDQIGTYFGGGGAGGALLIEAPVVTFTPNAQLLATGGDGGGCAPPLTSCTAGGRGATPTGAATRGVDIVTPGPAANGAFSGGGGGGLGRLRVNTADGSYTKANTTVEAAVVSSGPVKTR